MDLTQFLPWAEYGLIGIVFIALVALVVWLLKQIFRGDIATPRERERLTAALGASEEARKEAMGQVNDLAASLRRLVENTDLTVAFIRSLRGEQRPRQPEDTS